MSNEYTTRDFYLSSFLIAKGIPLKKHSFEDKHTVFTFEETPRTLSTADDYFSMQSNVEPLLFINAIKGLKAIVHQNNNSNSKVNNYVSQFKGKQ